MLTKQLLLEAAEQVAKARSKRVSYTFIQRRVRVGFVTASQLLDGLEEIGAVGPWEGSQRLVRMSTFDQPVVAAAIDRAVEEKRLVMDA